MVDGDRAAWVERCHRALDSAGFTKVEARPEFGQVTGSYKKLSVWGDIAITLVPDGDARTRIDATATAAVDNVYALFGSPGRKIIARFKDALSSA